MLVYALLHAGIIWIFPLVKHVVPANYVTPVKLGSLTLFLFLALFLPFSAMTHFRNLIEGPRWSSITHKVVTGFMPEGVPRVEPFWSYPGISEKHFNQIARSFSRLCDNASHTLQQENDGVTADIQGLNMESPGSLPVCFIGDSRVKSVHPSRLVCQPSAEAKRQLSRFIPKIEQEPVLCQLLLVGEGHWAGWILAETEYQGSTYFFLTRPYRLYYAGGLVNRNFGLWLVSPEGFSACFLLCCLISTSLIGVLVLTLLKKAGQKISAPIDNAIKQAKPHWEAEKRHPKPADVSLFLVFECNDAAYLVESFVTTFKRQVQFNTARAKSHYWRNTVDAIRQSAVDRLLRPVESILVRLGVRKRLRKWL